MTVLVMDGMITKGTISAMTASAPPYRKSCGSSPSTSSCKKLGGIRPYEQPPATDHQGDLPFARKAVQGAHPP